MSEELTYESYDGKSIIVFGNRNKFQKQINLIGGRWNSKKSGWILPASNKNKLESFISSLVKNESTVSPIRKYSREDEDEDEENQENQEDENELEEPVPEVPVADLIPIEEIKETNIPIVDDMEDNEEDDDVEIDDEIVNKLLHKYKKDDEKSDTRSNISINSKRDSVRSEQKDDRRDTRRDDTRRREEIRRREEEELRNQRRIENARRIQAREEEEKRRNSKHKYGKQDPMLYNKSFSSRGEEDRNPYAYYQSFNKKPVDFRRENDISDSESDSDVEDSTSYESSSSSEDDFPSPRTPRRRSDYNMKHNYGELVSTVQSLQKRLDEIENGKRRR